MKVISQKVRKLLQRELRTNVGTWKWIPTILGRNSQKKKQNHTYVNVVVASLFGIISYFAAVHITVNPVTSEI